MSRPNSLSDDEIIRRARAVFIERGFAVQTCKISAAVGLTWGAIARRFYDKRGLFQRAMAVSLETLDALEHEFAGGSDVVGLLDRIRAHLWERWPERLQLRLATSADAADGESKALRDWLASVLQDHASRGLLRTDISPQALAGLVLVVLTGDVAQRFLSREGTPTSDIALIRSLVTLLSAN